MAKVAILVPHREMCDLARRMVGQYANLTALCVEYVGMEDIPRRARELEAGGCELIVARGAHAHLVRDTVRLPLVELRTSAQELGRIVLGIRRELGEDCPRIGLISFANAICDTRYFNELFQIDLRLYPVSDNGEQAPAVEQARREGCLAVVGGKEIVAQCIHNDSLCRGNAFVTLDCSAYLPETLDNMLFGNYTTCKDTPASMAELAENGTLFVKNVEELSVETQYKLFNLIRGKFLHNGSNRPIAANVRVIASSCINLSSQIEKGSFCRSEGQPGAGHKAVCGLLAGGGRRLWRYHGRHPGTLCRRPHPLRPFPQRGPASAGV